jgi:hypothetical protein
MLPEFLLILAQEFHRSGRGWVLLPSLAWMMVLAGTMSAGFRRRLVTGIPAGVFARIPAGILILILS